MKKTYNCWTENEEGDCLDFGTIFYMVKNRLLIELDLENWYVIRQRKDLDLTYEDEENWKFDMKYWTLYCTRGNNIESIWDWRGEDDLKTWIKTCENYI